MELKRCAWIRSPDCHHLCFVSVCSPGAPKFLARRVAPYLIPHVLLVSPCVGRLAAVAIYDRGWDLIREARGLINLVVESILCAPGGGCVVIDAYNSRTVKRELLVLDGSSFAVRHCWTGIVVAALEFSPDGRTLAVLSKSMQVYMLNTNSGEYALSRFEATPAMLHAHSLMALGYAPNGGTIAVGALDDKCNELQVQVRRPDLSMSWKTMTAVQPKGSLEDFAITYSADGARIIAAVSGSAQVVRFCMFAVSSGTLLRIMDPEGDFQKPDTGCANMLGVPSADRIAVWICADNRHPMLHVLRASSGEELFEIELPREFPPPQANVTGILCGSPCGERTHLIDVQSGSTTQCTVSWNLFCKALISSSGKRHALQGALFPGSGVPQPTRAEVPASRQRAHEN